MTRTADATRPAGANPTNGRSGLRSLVGTRRRHAAVRLVVRRLEVGSFVRISAVLSFVLAVALVGVGVLVWLAARWIGVTSSLEVAVAAGLGLESWSFPSGALLAVWALGCALLGLVLVGVSALMVVAHNRASELIGGVEVDAGVRSRAGATE